MSDAAGGTPDGVRLLKFTCAAETAFQAIGFQADEEISQPFKITVELLSQTPGIDPNQLLAKTACLNMIRQDTGTRYFHGVVRSFVGTGAPIRGWYGYTAVLVPRLWLTRQTEDCRVFQQTTVNQILSDRCGEVSQTIADNTSGPKTREYITQYNETDLAFLHRLLEQEGYFYYFAHSAGDHVLQLCNSNSSFPASPKPSMNVAFAGGGYDVLTRWHARSDTAWGVVKNADYDPTAPSTVPAGSVNTVAATADGPKRDVFRWPARWFTSADAGSRASFEMEAAEAASQIWEAAGEAHMLSAGSRFTLSADPLSQAQGVDYVVQRISHSARDDSLITGVDKPFYFNYIAAFPAATNWRQPLATARPVLGGIYGAIVLGDSGEEIHADQYGRVKVQLFFDHRQDTTADKGVWARIVQPWAGNTWGWQHLPRVGTEVAVSFMDGDPDRPVVVGGLYNANMKPVFAIPGEQTKSGFRSRSTTGGGTSNFSEFSIDDKMGSELVYLHAEKDRTTEVEHDDKLTVMTGDRSVTVSQGNDSFTVSTGNHTTTISQGNHGTTVSTGNHSTEVNTGNMSIKVDLGSVTIEAMQSITLKVGASSVVINQQGVTVDGMQLAVGSGSTMQTQVQGLMVQTSGSGMAQHKGSIMMIN